MAKPSVTELAKRHEVSRSTLYNWKRAGVDIFSDEAVRAHRSARDNDGGEKPASPKGDPEMRAAWLRKLTAEADRAELALATMRGGYFSKAEVRAREAGIANVLNALFRCLTSEVPGLAAGLAAPEMEKVLKRWRDGWLGKITDARSDVWTHSRAEAIRNLRGDDRKAALRIAREEGDKAAN